MLVVSILNIRIGVSKTLSNQIALHSTHSLFDLH